MHLTLPPYRGYTYAMVLSSASPAPPEALPGVYLEELPVAETELEPPYRVLIHNDDATNHL